MSKLTIKALKISNINVSDIIISERKINSSVPISFRNQTLIFQTPFLEVLGGLKKTTYDDIYQLDTLFSGDAKHRINKWYQFLENLENHVSDQAAKNASKWFTKKNVIFKTLVKELESSKGTFYVKWLADSHLNIFITEDKKEFDPVNLKDKDLVKLIVEISELWIHENQYGLKVAVHKVMVKPHMEKIVSEYVFDTDSGEEMDEDEHKLLSLLATEQKAQPEHKVQPQPQHRMQPEQAVELVHSKSRRIPTKNVMPKEKNIPKPKMHVKNLSKFKQALNDFSSSSEPNEINEEDLEFD